MFLNCFLALVLAHLAGDFVFQTDKLCNLKKDQDIVKGVQGVSIHVASIFTINLVIFRLIFQDIPWLVLFLANLFHWLIDMLKSLIQAKWTDESDQAGSAKEVEIEKATEKIWEKPLIMRRLVSEAKTGNWEKELFVADQILHIASIFLSAYVFYKFDLNHFESFGKQFLSGMGTAAKSLTLTNKFLLILIYLCLATSVSNVVIKIFLGSRKKVLGEEDVKTGRYLGSIERILTISIILVSAWPALAVLYGSKTAIRFEKAKESPDFAEYYILGTAVSALFAVIIAACVKITLF